MGRKEGWRACGRMTDGEEEPPPLLLLPFHSIHRLLFTPPLFSLPFSFSTVPSSLLNLEVLQNNFPVSPPLPSVLLSRLLKLFGLTSCSLTQTGQASRLQLLYGWKRPVGSCRLARLLIIVNKDPFESCGAGLLVSSNANKAAVCSLLCL